MNWKITFYNQKVKTETLNFPSGILANFLHIGEMIEKLGPIWASHTLVILVQAFMK